MHCAYNEGTSVVAERFIRTLKCKIYKNVTANDGKSYLGYLNNIILLIKIQLMLIILLCLNKLRQILKHLNLNFVIETRLLSTRTFLANFTSKIGWKNKTRVTSYAFKSTS